MNSEAKLDFESELKKMKFHIHLLAEAIDYEMNPIVNLVVQFDWDEEELNSAHDIFERYDRQLMEGKTPSWRDLEKDLEKQLNIGYQGVKTIVNAFYRNKQWINVCIWFAKSQRPTCPVELKHILEK